MSYSSVSHVCYRNQYKMSELHQKNNEVYLNPKPKARRGGMYKVDAVDGRMIVARSQTL